MTGKQFYREKTTRRISTTNTPTEHKTAKGSCGSRHYKQ